MHNEVTNNSNKQINETNTTVFHVAHIDQ